MGVQGESQHTPTVIVPDVLGARAVWRQNNKKKNIYIYCCARDPCASTMPGTQTVVCYSRRPDNPMPILLSANRKFGGVESAPESGDRPYSQSQISGTRTRDSGLRCSLTLCAPCVWSLQPAAPRPFGRSIYLCSVWQRAGESPVLACFIWVGIVLNRKQPLMIMRSELLRAATWIIPRPEVKWLYNHEDGKNVTSFQGIASVASDMGWLWTGWIGPAPVQMSGMLSGRCAVVNVCGLLQGLIVFSLTFRFFMNSHLNHSRAWIPACSLTAVLLHRCFSSNLSTTTQGAIVKLHGACSELCTLFICSV